MQDAETRATKTVTQYRTPRRHNIQLITDPDEIYRITGKHSKNPRPRCGGCLKPTEVLRGYGGREVGRWCEDDHYFWRKIQFERVIKVEAYVPWWQELVED